MESDQKAKTQTLVERAQDGDRVAFDELCSRFRPGLVEWLGSQMGVHLRSKVAIDDVLQETFVWALKSIRRLEWKGEKAFDGWLCRIAKHVMLKAAAKSRQNPLRLDRDVAGSGVSASKAMRRGERFDRLEQAIQGLSEDHRRVIQMARLEGVPIKEIARRMERSPDAVSQLLLRALKKLRENFGDTESLGLPGRSIELDGGRSNDE